MNAIEKADQLTHGSHQWGFAWPLINESAALLRRQHEAIVKLRVALEGSVAYAAFLEKTTYRLTDASQIKSKQALKDTEDLK